MTSVYTRPVADESSPTDPLASDAAGGLVRTLRARLTSTTVTGSAAAELRLALVQALYAQHRHTEAIAEGEALLAVVSPSSPIHAQTSSILAGAYAQDGRPSDARRAAEHALSSPTADAETRVLARSALRGLAFLAGRYEGAVAEARAAEALARDAGPVGRAEARIDLGGMLTHLDAFEEATSWLTLDGDAPAHQRREADELLATMDLAIGRWTTVLDRLGRGDADLDADRSQASVTVRVGLRAAAWLHLDHVEEARRELLATPRPGSPHPTAMVVSALVADAVGDARGAAALLERVLAWADAYPYPPLARIWGPAMVGVALRADDPATAARIARSLDDAAGRTQVVSVHAAALTVRGLLERDASALASAVEGYAVGPRRVAHAQALEAHGTILVEGGSRDDGITALRRAHDAFRGLDAARDTRRVARRLADLGVRAGRGPAATRGRFGWDALTPTERTVAMLVGEGLSNAAVADRLVVSPRTVETHVAHVLAKLDVPSRAGIVRIVATRGDRARDGP